MSIKITLWKFLKKSKKINFYYRNKNRIKHHSVIGILRYLKIDFMKILIIQKNNIKHYTIFNLPINI